MSVGFGEYRFQLATGRLWFRGQELRLTPKAAGVLQILVSNAGSPVSKGELFAALWPDVAVTDDALTTCIQELRRVLSDDAKRPQFIETVHRRGYRFLAAVRTGPTQLTVSERPTPFHETGRHAPVGRDAELGQLRQWFEAALHGDGVDEHLEALGDDGLVVGQPVDVVDVDAVPVPGTAIGSAIEPGSASTTTSASRAAAARSKNPAKEPGRPAKPGRVSRCGCRVPA